MESHRENNNGDETTIPTVGSPVREEFQNQGGCEWSEEFNCETINGYLAPFPLSILPIEKDAKEEEEHEAESSHSESSKKRRTTEGNDELFFRLFKFSKAGEQYILEMHEVKTGRVDRSHLFVNESNGKWKVGAYDLAQGSYVVVPVLEDPCTSKFPPKHELSLQERLTGWTLEKRKRGNGKEDKFYYHGGRQFRSFVEVTTFILYSAKLKDLKTITTTDQNSDQVAEAPVIISSSDNHGNSATSTIKSAEGGVDERGKDTNHPNKPADEIEEVHFVDDDFVCDIFDEDRCSTNYDTDFRGGQV